MGGSMRSGQFRWWHAACGTEVGIVRLIKQLTRGQSRNAVVLGDWYVEYMATGATLFLAPERLGEEVSEMEVIAWSARA